jgi:ATP-dependent DNA ligase
MSLPLPRTYAPMEAQLVEELPRGAWQYEPKWDGFRCLAFRDGDEVAVQSKAGQPLARYFPELVRALLALRASRFVLDGELVVPIDGRLSFDALLQRIHPADSRVRKLSQETPAVLVVFDLLVDPPGTALVDRPLADRRPALEGFAAAYLAGRGELQLSPASRSREVAKGWLESAGTSLDGVVAKKLDAVYRSGERTAMRKVKLMRTAECVVGGLRWSAAADGELGSLLLGLYGGDNLLHHVGFTSTFSAAERPALLKQLRPLLGEGGFSGRAPGGPSRWGSERSGKWEPLRPELVAEVRYDQFTDGRFRHGTKLLRFRPDKPARRCTFEQVDPRRSDSLLGLLAAPPVATKRKSGRAARRRPSRHARSPRAVRSRRA